MDLSAPLDILKKENVEFEILVDRIEHACMRVEEDNNRLRRIGSKVTDFMQGQDNYKAKSLQKAVADRHKIIDEKLELRADYEA